MVYIYIVLLEEFCVCLFLSTLNRVISVTKTTFSQIPQIHKSTYFSYDTNCNIAPNLLKNIKSLQQVGKKTHSKARPHVSNNETRFLRVFWHIHCKVNIASCSNISKGQHEWPYLLMSKPYPLHSPIKTHNLLLLLLLLRSIRLRPASSCLWMLHVLPPPLANKTSCANQL